MERQPYETYAHDQRDSHYDQRRTPSQDLWVWSEHVRFDIAGYNLTIRKRRERMLDIKRLTALSPLEARHQSLDPAINNMLQLARARLGKEGCECRASHAMQVVVNRTTHGAYKTAWGDVPRPSLSLPVGGSVHFIVELDFANVYLPGINSQNGTVLLVKLFDLENVLASKNAVVVKFVPVRKASDASLPAKVFVATIM
jgi:hypothetical protein